MNAGGREFNPQTLGNTLCMWYRDDVPPPALRFQGLEILLWFLKAEVELHFENLPRVQIKGVIRKETPFFPYGSTYNNCELHSDCIIVMIYNDSQVPRATAGKDPNTTTFIS